MMQNSRWRRNRKYGQKKRPENPTVSWIFLKLWISERRNAPRKALTLTSLEARVLLVDYI